MIFFGVDSYVTWARTQHQYVQKSIIFYHI